MKRMTDLKTRFQQFASITGKVLQFFCIAPRMIRRFAFILYYAKTELLRNHISFKNYLQQLLKDVNLIKLFCGVLYFTYLFEYTPHFDAKI